MYKWKINKNDNLYIFWTVNSLTGFSSKSNYITGG